MSRQLFSISALLLAQVAAIAQTTVPPREDTRMRHGLQFRATQCAGDIPAGLYANDPDVRVTADSTLNVMFHGNRFVVARQMVDAFQKANPGQRVSYTAIPPSYTLPAIQNGSLQVSDSQVPFSPDLVMGNTEMGKALAEPGLTAWKAAPGVLYSRARGLVLIGRSGDPKFAGREAAKILQDPTVRLVVPGYQSQSRPLSRAIFAAALDLNPSNLSEASRLGMSQMRHHRSIPARLLAGCEDAGFQFLQSQPYLEAEFPGKFQFIPYALDAQSAASEESYVYVSGASKRRDAAEKFAAFMTSPQAIEILKQYRLEP